MKNQKIKIIFWGTPEFAIPSLSALIEHGYKIAAVVTNPDEPVGRKQILTPPPVKVFSQKHKIPVFQPASLKSSNIKKELPEADLYIVAAYGKIIPKEIIDFPKYGSLNIHPSLLPRWRGPSPIQYTILNGDTETGVTIIKMDELMDHGPILASRELAISKTTYKELHDKLAKLGAELLVDILPKWITGNIKLVPQKGAEATYSKILKKDDGRIDWSQPAEKIERMVRAFNPWPGAWTVWNKNNKFFRLKIEEAKIVAQEPERGSYGYAWQTTRYPLLVKTGQGSVALKRVTMEGKKSMDITSFLPGFPQIVGETLI